MIFSYKKSQDLPTRALSSETVSQYTLMCFMETVTPKLEAKLIFKLRSDTNVNVVGDKEIMIL